MITKHLLKLKWISKLKYTKILWILRYKNTLGIYNNKFCIILYILLYCVFNMELYKTNKMVSIINDLFSAILTMSIFILSIISMFLKY